MNPVINDLSAYVIAGRVTARPGTRNETSARTPAQGVQDGVDAEQIGFRRVFLSERWNLKEAGILLGAIAARTQRIDVATGVFPPAARHPMHAAAMGSTMHAAFGPRFILGLGRGDDEVMNVYGLGQTSLPDLRDYVGMIRRMWAGEDVHYDGPLGRFPQMRLDDRHEGPDPQIWFGTFGLKRAAHVAAECMDGVLLVPNLTPDATAAAVERIRSACADIGRDPASIHIAQCVITAPELDEIETAEIADARLLTYLDAPGYKVALARANGWDLAMIDRIGRHEQLRGHAVIADQAFHRAEMLKRRVRSRASGSTGAARSGRSSTASRSSSASAMPAPTSSSPTGARRDRTPSSPPRGRPGGPDRSDLTRPGHPHPATAPDRTLERELHQSIFGAWRPQGAFVTKRRPEPKP
jgi:5,10-methylenetetrahydromethanopterin reductase